MAKEWYVFVFFVLGGIILILAAVLGVLYYKTSKMLDTLDKMLEDAASGCFEEKNFSEERLSRIEEKMSRYLSGAETGRSRILAERDAVKTLVSDISHQTKTPIANILLYAQLLNETEGLPKNAAKLADQIERQAGKLKFLIQSLIKTSRLEQGIVAVHPKKNSIRELLEQLDFSAEAEKKDIRITAEPIPDVYASFDMKWTCEAVGNMIDNAVKYTPHGGQITLSVKEYELFVRIDITDTGIGMAEAETAKIFQRFYRSPKVSEEPGVGIGLYLTREVLTRENGYVKVKTAEGKGSTFSVFLAKQTNSVRTVRFQKESGKNNMQQ